MKASRTKDSKGVVVLTTPLFDGLPKNHFFKFFKRQIIYLVKKVWWCPKKPVSLSRQTPKDTTNMNALLWILVIVLALWEDRSVLFWLLVAWITKPVVVIILLLLIGKSE